MATEKELEASVSEKDIANAQKVPGWLQYVFVKASDSIKYNCGWGFITAKEASEEEFKSYLPALKQNNGKMIMVNQLANGYVFEIPLNAMMKVFKTIIPDVPNEVVNNYLTENQKIYNKDKEDAEKFLMKMMRDAKKAPNKVAVADFSLYCINATNALKQSDREFKAYKMSIPVFLKLLESKGIAHNFAVQDMDGKGPVIPITKPEIGKAIKIADSCNGTVCRLICKA